VEREENGYRSMHSSDDDMSISTSSNDVNDVQMEEIVIDGCNLSHELRLLNQNEAYLTTGFLSRLRQRSVFSDQAIKSFLELLGKTPLSSRVKNCNLIEQWIEAPVEKRRYIFMTKVQLVDCCLEKLQGSKTSYQKKKNDELIDLLVQSRETTHDVTHATLQATDHLSPQNVLSERLLKDILTSSFLKPLTGGDRKNCRIGLENEETLLRRLLENDAATLSLVRDGSPGG